MSTESKDKGPFDDRIALLRMFQNLVNPSDEAQISVTLNVHGTVVSGTMIGMKRYYEEVSKTVIETARAKSEEEVSYVRKELQKLFDIVRQRPAEVENQSNGFRYDNIFLKGVEIYTAFGKVNAPHWVGRIGSVDGFVLGQYMSYP